MLAWLRSCTSHLLNGILATPDGYAATACICREGDRGLCSRVTAEVFAMAPFNSHTHRGSWKVSLLPGPPFCSGNKTALKGCNFMEPWSPCHFCPQAPLGDLWDPDECWLVFSWWKSRVSQRCRGRMNAHLHWPVGIWGGSTSCISFSVNFCRGPNETKILSHYCHMFSPQLTACTSCK